LLGFFVFFKKKLASGNMLKRKEKFLHQGKAIPGNFFEKNRAKPLLFKA
jgi:hypothetical protein